MGKTSYGYSLRLAKLNGAASVASLGVQLGRACIEHNVPVVDVARRLGVSRQTVYNWFIGRSIPMKSTEQKINHFILSLSR
jgi:transcriptional regulator with XRE-family HTH domain